MLTISVAGYEVALQHPGLPAVYREFAKHARLADEHGLAGPGDDDAWLAVGNPGEWPFLSVAWRCDPGESAAFHPHVLIVPETDVLFLGGGRRIFAYDLSGPGLIWEDEVDVGLLGWCQHGDVVLMSAECELAAWGTNGEKLWSTWVEPPWSYTVNGDWISLDVDGRKSGFRLVEGRE